MNLRTRNFCGVVLLAMLCSASQLYALKAEKRPGDQQVNARHKAGAVKRVEITPEQAMLVDAAGKAGIGFRWNERLGVPARVRGPGLGKVQAFSKGKGLKSTGGVSLEKDAVAVMDNLSGMFRIKDAQKEVAVRRSEKDLLGFHHVRMKQMYEGLRVVGGEITVHFDRANDAYEVNGRFVPDISIATKPEISGDEALARTKKDMADRGLPEGKSAALPELVVLAVDDDPVLVYELTMGYEDAVFGVGRWRYWIGASDGTVLRVFNDVKTVSAPTSSGSNSTLTGSILTGEGGGATNLSGWYETGNTSYYLYDKTLLWYVFNAHSSGYTDANTYAYRKSTSAWSTTDRTEMSAARNFRLTQKYFKDVHGRNSFNNAGAYARANVHYQSNWVNAQWNGSSFDFGDGDSVEANSLAVLDICAHEFAHAVTEYSANLDYYAEPGALNESYSDIFGACVEFYGEVDDTASYPSVSAGKADWLCGEDAWLSSKALRDLRSPSNSSTVGAGNEQPARYKGTYWYYGTSDNAGVHQNSGVQNFVFYLLCAGGSGINDGTISYNVTGIGITNAEKIAYRALTLYCDQFTDYAGSREAWVSAAADLNPAWVTSVEDAWSAVGVGSSGSSAVATPSFNPAGGVYASSLSVTVSVATAGANIYYTLDGSEPSESSTPYSSPISVSSSGTIKAKAFKTGVTPSVTAIASYSFLGTRIYSFPMSSSPGWTTSGQWAYGVPSGGGGEHGSPDPASGYTGSSVYGYNLAGDYANSIGSSYWLTTSVLNLSTHSNVKLVYRRWLGVERPAYDHAYVDVSNNGTTWTRIWENSAEIADSSWTQVVHDISAVADMQSAVYVRWGMGPTDGSFRYCGWNLDDVEIWGESGVGVAPNAPTGLAAVVTISNVALSWQDRSSNEQGFSVERKMGAGSWGEITTVGANSSVYNDATVAASSNYTYRVRSYNSFGYSAYSEELAVTIPGSSGDVWDPGDDTGAGATVLPVPTSVVQAHGPHVLDSVDYYDWFAVDLTGGKTYNFNSVGGSGDSYAELFSDSSGTTRVAADDDSGGNLQFSLSYDAGITGTYYLRVRNYSIGSSVSYSLKYQETPAAGGSITLTNAVDSSGLVLTTGGNAVWYGQSVVTHDGVDAAQSGAIGDRQSAWLQTTVTGPGTLSYNWNVSSEENWDYLLFYYDGVTQSGITGEPGWQSESWAIPAGVHTLRWSYTKDRSYFSGSDCGWLDEVVWTPDVPPSVSITSPAEGDVFSAAANIPLSMNATDSDGAVSQVVLYDNSRQIGRLVAAPYNMTFSNVVAGVHRLTAVAMDDLGVMSTSTPVTVYVGIPDFSIENIRLNPTNPAVGTTFAAYVTVTNSGLNGGSAGYLYAYTNKPSEVALKASPNGSYNVGYLASGQGRTVAISGLKAGTAAAKTFRAFIDATGQTLEVSETNNQAVLVYAVVTKPDLKVTGVSLFPSTPARGGVFSAKVTVKNAGSGVASNVYVSVWADRSAIATNSLDTNKDGSAALGANIGTIGTNTSVVYTFTGLDAWTGKVARVCRVLADSDLSIDEILETNNQLALGYTPASRPDFMIMDITLSTTNPVVGSNFVANVTVKNIGYVSGEAGYLDVWTDKGTNVVPNSNLKGEKYQSVGTLNTNVTKTLTFTQLPAGTNAVSKVFRAVVDSRAAKTEVCETNNQNTVDYTVKP